MLRRDQQLSVGSLLCSDKPIKPMINQVLVIHGSWLQALGSGPGRAQGRRPSHSRPPPHTQALSHEPTIQKIDRRKIPRFYARPKLLKM